MTNNLYQPRKTFTSGHRNDQETVGGINKTNKIITINKQRESIEAQFMAISFKANRSDTQREERRNKRK